MTSGVSKRHKTTIAAIACRDFDIVVVGYCQILSDVVCSQRSRSQMTSLQRCAKSFKRSCAVLQFVFSSPWSSCSMLLLKSHGIVDTLVIFGHLWSSLTSPFFLKCRRFEQDSASAPAFRCWTPLWHQRGASSEASTVRSVRVTSLKFRIQKGSTAGRCPREGARIVKVSLACGPVGEFLSQDAASVPVVF